jgi:hypothetical protein
VASSSCLEIYETINKLCYSGVQLYSIMIEFRDELVPFVNVSLGFFFFFNLKMF